MEQISFKKRMIITFQKSLRNYRTLEKRYGWRLDSARRLLGYKILHCWGDSHIQMFDYLRAKDTLPKTLIRCEEVRGATAMGLVNPNSRTNALHIFMSRLQFVSRKSYILTMLGEVDCGFLIWYQAEKKNMSIESQFEYSLTNYQDFLLTLYSKGYTHLIISTVSLPTIQDGQSWGEIANARRDVKASIRERTDLTLAYNQRLREFAAENKFRILDFEDEILDSKTQLISQNYLNENPLDHHLNNTEIVSVLAEKLTELGFK